MFSDPQKNLEQFVLQPGYKVADLGSGSGFYTFVAAKMVGEKGKVYSIDVMKDMLQKIKNEAIRSHITNIETLWGNIEKLGGTRLGDSSVDAVLVCNTLFQLEDKEKLPFEAKRILKPGGRVLLVDWNESYGGMGPQANHVISPEKSKDLFTKAGFTLEREIKAGAHHYGIIFKRS